MNSPGGWFIDLTKVDLSNGPLECQIWGGVGNDCSLNTPGAQLLGIVEIQNNNVTFYTKSDYGSVGYELYAGTCPMSDGGTAFTQSSSACPTEYSPFDINTYPLTTGVLP
jgi:hypothetical protein